MTLTPIAQRLTVQAEPEPGDDQIPAYIKGDAEAAARNKTKTERARRIIESEALKSTRNPMIPFAEKYKEKLAQVKLSDPDLTYEERHERAFRLASAEAATHRFALSAPTDPTPPDAESKDLFATVDENLVESDVTYARQVAAVNKPKTPAPTLGQHYKAALKTIATSPDMSQSDALRLAKAARAKDVQEQIDRNAALSNPAPNSALVDPPSA